MVPPTVRTHVRSIRLRRLTTVTAVNYSEYGQEPSGLVELIGRVKSVQLLASTLTFMINMP